MGKAAGERLKLDKRLEAVPTYQLPSIVYVSKNK